MTKIRHDVQVECTTCMGKGQVFIVETTGEKSVSGKLDCPDCVEPKSIFTLTPKPWEVKKEESQMGENMTGASLATLTNQDPPPKKEAVKHPTHYNAGKVEVIDAIESWRLGFNDGNAVKYIGRHKFKQNAAEDLKKALWYLTRELLVTHHVAVDELAEIVKTCVK